LTLRRLKKLDRSANGFVHHDDDPWQSTHRETVSDLAQQQSLGTLHISIDHKALERLLY